MNSPTQESDRAWMYLFTAWLLALVATLGALFVGEIMGQTPCVLCWCQRIFMFPLAILLAFAAFFDDRHVVRYGLALALPGGIVALYHALIYAGIIPERITPCMAKGPSCSDANMLILGLPLPYLSVVSFTLIAVLLVASRRRTS
jgi:disulfide bond formation protein DsbB